MVRSGSGFSTRGKIPGTRGSWLVCCCGDIYFTYRFLTCFCDFCCLYTLSPLFLADKNATKDKKTNCCFSQLQKAERGEGESTSGEVRVEDESTSGEVRVEDESTSGEARVVGESTSGEARVEGESTSDEARVEGEQSTNNDGEEQDSTVKRPRLEDISTLAAEPLQEWLENLPRYDLRHFVLLLYTTLPGKFGLQKTDTATAVADILQKNERTVRRWIGEFVQNDGEFSDTLQGHYVRENTLMFNEELCEKARVYVRANAAPRGRPNLTSSVFCQWVNNDLLPNSVLEPGYPRRVSVETARK